MRFRTMRLVIGTALVFRTTSWQVSGWPSLATEGPTHSSETAGSSFPLGASSLWAPAGSAAASRTVGLPVAAFAWFMYGSLLADLPLGPSGSGDASGTTVDGGGRLPFVGSPCP